MHGAGQAPHRPLRALKFFFGGADRHRADRDVRARVEKRAKYVVIKCVSDFLAVEVS